MMRTSTRFALGLATAGVVAAGGSAITTSNATGAVNAGDKVLGYGSVTATGATVETIAYNIAVDGSELAGGVFKVTETLASADYQAFMVAELSGSNVTSNACTLTPVETTKTQITCAFASGTEPAVSTIVSIGLTVASKTP